MTDRKADAFLTMQIDALGGKTLVTGYLRPRDDPGRRMQSFSCLATDAQLLARLPEWLAELRAEAQLGCFESMAQEAARLSAQSSGSATTEKTSLNSICTSRGPVSGPRSFTR